MDNAQDLTIRPLSLDDAQATLDLVVACEVAEYGEPESDLEDLVDQWSDIVPDQDAWLALSPDSHLVGYAAVFGADASFTYDAYVHPTLAPYGLYERLLAHCEARIGDKAKADAGTPITATTYLAHVNLVGRQILEAHAYEPVRHHFGMRIQLDAPPPLPVWPEGITLRRVVPEQDDRLLYEFIQAAFDRPGRVPPSFESWCDTMLGAHNFQRDLWFMAYCGDDLIGAALCFQYPEYGWVRQLGGAQPWRRQGIGSALLRHAFGVFHQRGYTRVGLGVESTNARAYQLYEKVGMKPVRQYIEYSKALTSA